MNFSPSVYHFERVLLMHKVAAVPTTGSLNYIDFIINCIFKHYSKIVSIIYKKKKHFLHFMVYLVVCCTCKLLHPAVHVCVCTLHVGLYTVCSTHRTRVLTSQAPVAQTCITKTRSLCLYLSIRTDITGALKVIQ